MVSAHCRLTPFKNVVIAPRMSSYICDEIRLTPPRRARRLSGVEVSDRNEVSEVEDLVRNQAV